MGRHRWEYFVVQVTGSEDQGLADVLVFEFRVLAFEFVSVRVSGKSLRHAPHRQPQVSDARFPFRRPGSVVIRSSLAIVFI